MADFPVRDYTVLCAVHTFFLKVLGTKLHHEIPLPAGITGSPTTSPSLRTVETLRYWVNVLDLAVTPPMFRDELANGDEDTAAALLKYYTHNPEQLATDRDKTDFVVTWLYRHSPREFTRSGEAFEQRVSSIIGAEARPLPEEYGQLLREFDFIRKEVADASHFDKLVDSAMVERVRDIKASFGKWFYHPTVLATVATYNVEFGAKFDELFKEATRQIREFAKSVQSEGGDSMTPVESGVVVKQLEDIEEQKILKTDYREAQEQFRKVSRFKKAVDKKRKRPVGVPMASAASASPSVPIRTVAEAKSSFTASSWQTAEEDRLALMVPNDSSLAVQIEESKMVTLADSIRHFIQAADPTRAHVVPVKHGNITLAPHEVEAFRADYFLEKSFRGEFAFAIMKIVSCGARIDAELSDFQRTQSSAYLWKPHADSLTSLIKNSQALTTEAGKLKATALQRGLTAKANGIDQSISKLQQKVNGATSTLAQLDSR